MSWIVDIGIRAEALAQQIATRFGEAPLQWPTQANPAAIIHRLPRDPHARASIFAKRQTIVVSEGERAIVLENGKAGGTLEPGRYVFEKARVVGSLDIVWVRCGQRMLKWGLGNVASSDGIQISANGVLYVRVVDVLPFNNEVIQGRENLVDLDLQAYLLPRLQGALRATIARFPALELQSQRESFHASARGALAQALQTLGLELVDFEAVEIGYPAEFKAAIARAALAEASGRGAVVEAQYAAHTRQLEAAAEAQAQLTTGLAQIQLMAGMQAQGIDPLRLKAMEALETLAANPAQGMLLGDPRAGLIGQIAMASLTAPPVVPIQASPAAQPPAALAPPAPPLPAAASPDAERAEIERQIDSLVSRLAEGAITEATYQKLVERLESKLARLG